MLIRALRALGFGANGSEKTGSIAKVFRLVNTFAKEEPSAFESGKVLNQLMTALGKEAPYVDEELAYTIILKERTTFWRFYSDVGEVTSPKGKWVTIKDEVEGLTGAQAKDLLSLPTKPTKMIPVEVEAGTRVRISRTGANAYGKGGRIQVELLDKIESGSFKIADAVPLE